MPLVFQTKPGSVVKLDDPAMACSTNFLSLGEDHDITFDHQKSIITRVTISQQVNVQFLHSLGSLIHIYVFGDRMGQVSLSGLAFSCDCPENSPVTEIGAERMLTWYKQNRASKRDKPCRVTIGKTTIEGFVTGITEDVVDPALRLVQWGVTMASLPEDD